MKIPQLEKKPELKSCHNVNWEDNYSWVHQSNILEVLRDSSKLAPQVRNYLEEENAYTNGNGGNYGGQEVPHLHFHLFGGERVGKMVQ